MSNVHLLQIEILDIFPRIPFMIFSSYEFIGTEIECSLHICYSLTILVITKYCTAIECKKLQISCLPQVTIYQIRLQRVNQKSSTSLFLQALHPCTYINIHCLTKKEFIPVNSFQCNWYVPQETHKLQNDSVNLYQCLKPHFRICNALIFFSSIRFMFILLPLVTMSIRNIIVGGK